MTRDTNPDHVHGCYCYETQEGHTVVHVFTDKSSKCTCGNRKLNHK